MALSLRYFCNAI